MRCAHCQVYACTTGDRGRLPENCPMRDYNLEEVYEKARKEYQKEEVNRIALNAARVEAAGYGNWTRLEETMEFCRRAGFRKLGLAFCMGLREEAKRIANILENNGFEVYSVVCKTGSVPKEELGLLPEEKLKEGHDPMCNPIGQAELLNAAGTDFNILVGLCVGHDTLFIKYSQAPVTVLVAKDRVLAHNPLGAIYAYYYYHRKLDKHKL